PAIQAQSDRTLLLDNALRRALERQQLELHYQPQISMQTGQTVGAEALLRWTHPELGPVSPAEFIPIAESSGLVLPIGEWVLEQAAAQVAAWDREGLTRLVVAINVSSVQLHRGDLPALVRRAVERAGIECSRLEIELTEGAAMKNPHAAAEVMNALAAQGVGLAIDDFGTGYSSLSYLKRFPVATLKIDRSFVADLAVDADDRAIVDAIVKMASSLGMRTVAEGVETEAQRIFLQQRGCSAMQGYLLSRLLAPAALADFVRSHSAGRGVQTR
ncbi:MAG: EAL domain-containing protein, partial [Burkholderiaceae bacterium]